MKNILTVNKLLIAAAVFFGLMAAQLLLFPTAKYDQRLAETHQQTQALQQQKTDREAQVAQAVTDTLASLSQQQERSDALAAQLQEAEQRHEATAARAEALRQQVALFDDLPTAATQLRTQYGDLIRQLEDKINAGTTDIKICYLTFDDGPSNITASFLKKLAEYDVPATFFTIGANTSVNQEENLRAEMMAGHTIANHTYSHAYYAGGIYRSLEELTKQILLQDEWVYNTTGFHTEIFRFPTGSYSCSFREEATAWLEENGFQWIDWTSNAYDSGANATAKPPKQIAENMIYQCKQTNICVMLCHDWNSSTLQALDTVIPKLRAAGYVFLPMFPQSCTMGDATSPQFS